MENLQFVTDKLFVTNVQYSADAQTYANYSKIELRNDNKLRYMHYLMSIGRLNSDKKLFLTFHFQLRLDMSKQQDVWLLIPTYNTALELYQLR